MAKKNQNVAQAEVVSTPNTTEVVTPVEVPQADEPQQADSSTPQADEPVAPKLLVLKLARITPNGVASYEVDGLRGSLYITKSMFGAAGAPKTLAVEAGVFADPKVAASKKEADPEVTRKKAEELQAKAAKAQERAARLVKKANTLLGVQAEPQVENAFAGVA